MDEVATALECATMLQGPQFSVCLQCCFCPAHVDLRLDSTMGSSLQGQALATGQIYTSQKGVLMNLGTRDQHSPGYNRAIITLCLGNGPSPALQHQLLELT